MLLMMFKTPILYFTKKTPIVSHDCRFNKALDLVIDAVQIAFTFVYIIKFIDINFLQQFAHIDVSKILRCLRLVCDLYRGIIINVIGEL